MGVLTHLLFSWLVFWQHPLQVLSNSPPAALGDGGFPPLQVPGLIHQRQEPEQDCVVQMPELGSPQLYLLIRYQSKQMVVVSPGVTKERAVLFQYFQTIFAFYSFFFLAFVSINI